jgi:hypothetical protein
MHPRPLGRLACLVAALAASITADSSPGAAQMAPAPIGSGRVFLAPYAWLAGISGEADVRDLSTDVDVPFRELLQHLQFAAMGTLEGGHGPVLAGLDAVYTSVRVDRTPSRGPRSVDLTAKMKMLITTGYAGVSLRPSPQVAVDLYGGTRVWSVDASLAVSGDSASRARSRSPAWADALAGARVRWRPSEQWQVGIAGDGGAGGSRGTANASATAGYEVSRRWTAFAAYRWLYLDYSRDEFRFRGHLAGPVLGVAYRG